MGGNAFDNTQRLTEAQYRDLCAKIAEILREIGVTFSFPPEIADKADLVLKYKGDDRPYGDVDVIVGLEDGHVTSREVTDIVFKALKCPERPKTNSATHNLITQDGHQVDLLYTNRDNVAFMSALKANNDFLAFFGHLMTEFGLKMTPKGLTLKIELGKTMAKKDLALTKDLTLICEFFGLEGRCLDGETRLTSQEAFEAIVKSRIYFHRKKEFDEKYHKRESRKGRAMIQRLFELLDDYEGQFEDKKDEGHLVRMAFKDKAENLEEFILNYFSKSDEAAKIRETSKAKFDARKKLDFMEMWSWFPDKLDAQKGVLVVKHLRQKFAGGSHQEFNLWVNQVPEERLKEEVANVVEELNL